MQDAISSLLLAICLWQINGRSHPAHESTRRVAPQETQHDEQPPTTCPPPPNTPTSQRPHTRNQGQARRANHQPTPAAPGHDPSPTHGNRRPHRPARSSHSRPTPGTRTRCHHATHGEQSRYVPDRLLLRNEIDLPVFAHATGTDRATLAPGQCHGLEEVRGDETLGSGTQERRPGAVRALRCRIDAGVFQDLLDCGGGDLHPEDE